ncbi:hypothetical protein Tco_1062469 [Tanacetum coccineum]
MDDDGEKTLWWTEVIHTVKIDKVRQIVDVESSGKSADEIDKETVSFDMNPININSIQVFDQLNISNEFAPFSGKSVQKLGIDLKLLKWHLVNIHIIE